LLISIHKQANVCKERWFPVESTVELQVLGGGYEPLLLSVSHYVGTWACRLSTNRATNDVGDCHKMVVYDIREVVSGVAISFDDNEVIFALTFTKQPVY
jgi:hypothetical protein